MLITGLLLVVFGLLMLSSRFVKAKIRRPNNKLVYIVAPILIVAGAIMAGQSRLTSSPGPDPAPYQVKTDVSLSALQNYVGDGGNALAYKEVTNVSNGALRYVQKFEAGTITSAELGAYLQNNYTTVSSFYGSYGLQKAPEGLASTDRVLRSNAKEQIMYVGFLRNAAQNDDTSTLEQNASSLQSYITYEQSIESQLTTIQRKDAAAQGKQAAGYQSPGPQQVSVGGGLGDTLKTVEKFYGMPTAVTSPMTDGVGSYDFGQGISVSFEDGRAYLFQHDFTGGQAHFAMQVTSNTVFPKDATAPTTTSSSKQGSSNEFVATYNSAELAKVFPSKLFVGPNGLVTPGSFTLVETEQTGDTAISLSIGNNP